MNENEIPMCVLRRMNDGSHQTRTEGDIENCKLARGVKSCTSCPGYPFQGGVL